MLPSYRNQSIDLQSKSINWFLYVGNTGTKWVNGTVNFFAKHSLTDIWKSSKYVCSISQIVPLQKRFLMMALVYSRSLSLVRFVFLYILSVILRSLH